MKAVMINGEDSGIRGDGLSNFADLVELIKGVIDPDHMITSILVEGRELEESDWTAPLGRFSTTIVEIETGPPMEFVQERLASASSLVNTCYLEFREARKLFQNGEMQSGNRHLVQAVNTLQAFFQWYSTMLELIPEGERHEYQINSQVQEISDVCKRICQQQLYQSWWALGETLETELEPKLDKLEDFYRKWAKKTH